MTKENWITIGIAVMAQLITITGFIMTWKNTTRQLQNKSAEAIEAKNVEKVPNNKPIGVWYFVLTLALFGAASGLFGVIWHFTSGPQATRFQSVILLFNFAVLIWNVWLFLRVLRAPHYQREA